MYFESQQSSFLYYNNILKLDLGVLYLGWWNMTFLQGIHIIYLFGIYVSHASYKELRERYVMVMARPVYVSWYNLPVRELLGQGHLVSFM